MHVDCAGWRNLGVLGARHYPHRLHRLAQAGGPVLGARHFSCKFSSEIALVTRPCAFCLRRLALLVCGIFAVNFRMNRLLPAKFLSRTLGGPSMISTGP